MINRTVTLEQYRTLAADARAAFRMIREAVEQHAPPGSVPSEEMWSRLLCVRRKYW